MKKNAFFLLFLLLMFNSCNTGGRRNCDTIGKRFAEISSRLDNVKKDYNLKRAVKLRKLKEISEQATRLANDFEGCQIDKKETTLGDQIGQFVDEFRVEQLRKEANRLYEQFQNEPDNLLSSTESRIPEWQIKSSIRKLEDRLQDLLNSINLETSGSFTIDGQSAYIESISVADMSDGLVLQCNDGAYCFSSNSTSMFSIPMDQAKAKRISVYLNDYKQLVACFHNGGQSCRALVEKYTD